MGRLVVVSNRVPAPRERSQPAGGLAVGVRDAVRGTESLWFGWSGRHTTQSREQTAKLDTHESCTYATIDLTRSEYEHFYEKFSNGLLWPLCHYRIGIIDYKRIDYQVYREVNALFADQLVPLLREDDTLWVHDYHLFPLGAKLRRRGIKAKIGFFLHIPFPPWSVTRVLPCAEEMLREMAAYDLIGVQTEEDARNMNGCFEANNLPNRAVHFPIGIDPVEFNEQAEQNVMAEEVQRLQASLRGRKLILGVDRLDYSKGIPERIHGYETFLNRYPEHKGETVLLQITPVSRAGVASYRALRRELDEMAGHINAMHGNFDWSPIRYLTQSVPREVLAGFHRIADVALVTPLRDGMNLVAKEFVAAQSADDPGALILSSLAGAAPEMEQALMVNPYDHEGIADAIHAGITMSLEERQRRWQALHYDVTQNTAANWADRFLEMLRETERQE
ncbi:alpha,alpha-trehalose-phosphate synthase (UDP-forming) [Asaia bogorensis]|uniref:Trehalose-6-phosphate synthase n=1 Tax=Asaia bogorensis NBRC 16594 TaxID=1231624 RepID=A0AAN4U3J6_9PROT|nr:trehalose-6-phosphate synthase [Asaia bogorensis]BAT21047.1 alpha,alpha-trehalose-phosphate synthase [Asaia bogorensis NBRC 16594]GBQ74351.1 alpha,alpha-trehalose-phosphate synthase [Asaia bogorensis NBRC 16594]GEL54583.1 trehalose-6-phosphate synthase [Asaia bogorensis NBRC 16594]